MLQSLRFTLLLMLFNSAASCATINATADGGEEPPELLVDTRSGDAVRETSYFEYVHDEPTIAAELANDEVVQVYDFYKAHFPTPFWRHEESEWEEAISQLLERSGEIGISTHYFDLAQILNMAMDTHVQFYADPSIAPFGAAYPLRFRMLEDGLTIMAAGDPYRHLVGARVLSVGGTKIDEFVSQIGRFAFSDNPARETSFAIEYLMRQPAFYHYFGLMNAQDDVLLELEMYGGKFETVTLNQVISLQAEVTHSSGQNAGYYWPEGWTTLQTLGGHDAPLSRQNLHLNYWHTDLADGDIVYFQINKPVDQEGRPTLSEYTTQVFETLFDRPRMPSRFILDLRHNLGGTINLQAPLVGMLSGTGYCCGEGEVVVLIAHETISAGSMMAGFLERDVAPVAIGQPTGGRPNIYTYAARLELPYSSLGPVEVSRFEAVSTDSADDRLAITPDIHIAETMRDIVDGRDPALEYAIAISREEAARFFVDVDSLLSPWLRPSQRLSNEPGLHD